ncbi:hypothetical protein NP493_55g08006 [Ridgeia piscesae]|uniref:Uncharacterized protein n=1 Tax=Ridgeia piscesae TaxID=27915 RepID=A0AAD9PAU9_RIDPI|nr:hypothetical protein NP493_55g08006 [Ridgeia piscesae]
MIHTTLNVNWHSERHEWRHRVDSMGRNKAGKKKQKKDMSVFKVAGSKIAKTKMATQKVKTNLKKMNNLTKTKTATADAKFLEMAQDVMSAASTKQSTKSDVTKPPKQPKTVRAPVDMNAAADQFAQL